MHYLCPHYLNFLDPSLHNIIKSLQVVYLQALEFNCYFIQSPSFKFGIITIVLGRGGGEKTRKDKKKAYWHNFCNTNI